MALRRIGASHDLYDCPGATGEPFPGQFRPRTITKIIWAITRWRTPPRNAERAPPRRARCLDSQDVNARSQPRIRHRPLHRGDVAATPCSSKTAPSIRPSTAWNDGAGWKPSGACPSLAGGRSSTGLTDAGREQLATELATWRRFTTGVSKVLLSHMKRSLRSWLWRVPLERRSTKSSPCTSRCARASSSSAAWIRRPHASWRSSRLGDVARLKRTMTTLGRKRDRDMRLTQWLDELRDDLKFALRQLRRAPASRWWRR